MPSQLTSLQEMPQCWHIFNRPFPTPHSHRHHATTYHCTKMLESIMLLEHVLQLISSIIPNVTTNHTPHTSPRMIPSSSHDITITTVSQFHQSQQPTAIRHCWGTIWCFEVCSIPHFPFLPASNRTPPLYPSLLPHRTNLYFPFQTPKGNIYSDKKGSSRGQISRAAKSTIFTRRQNEFPNPTIITSTWHTTTPKDGL